MSTLVLLTKAAEESTYSIVHIRHLVRDGLINGEKQGGIWLVDLDALKRYEEEMGEAGRTKYVTQKNKQKLSKGNNN
jgi:hypothetical protein